MNLGQGDTNNKITAIPNQMNHFLQSSPSLGYLPSLQLLWNCLHRPLPVPRRGPRKPCLSHVTLFVSVSRLDQRLTLILIQENEVPSLQAGVGATSSRSVGWLEMQIPKMKHGARAGADHVYIEMGEKMVK